MAIEDISGSLNRLPGSPSGTSSVQGSGSTLKSTDSDSSQNVQAQSAEFSLVESLDSTVGSILDILV